MPRNHDAGQTPDGDLTWLGLIKGRHYSDVIDISEYFKTFNPRYRTFNKYSLQNTAAALLKGPLKMDMAGAHSARNDSIAGVRLYRLWVGANEKERAQFLNILESTKHPPSVVKTHQFKIDGVCMTSKFKFCSCNRK